MSATEPVRKALSFQSLTNMKNFSTSIQDGQMQRCHLPWEMSWPAPYRSLVSQSNSKALSLKVLGEYTAALHAHFIHSRSLLMDQKLQPAPEVGLMINAHTPFQNLVSDLQAWNEEAKACAG
jgi:hypothetical protein